MNTNQMNVEILTKSVSQVKGKSNYKDILSGIHFNDRFAYACDGSALYKCLKPETLKDFKGNHPVIKGKLDLTEAIEGNYPDADKLIPEDFEVTNELTFSSTTLKQIASTLKSWSWHVTNLTFKGQSISFNTKHRALGLDYNLSLDTGIDLQECSLYLNKDKLATLFSILSQDDKASYNLAFCFNGTLKPLVITITKGTETVGLFLIMPIQVDKVPES